MLWAKALVETLQRYLLQPPSYPSWTLIPVPAQTVNMQPGQIALNNASLSAVTQVWFNYLSGTNANTLAQVAAVRTSDLFILTDPVRGWNARYRVTGIGSSGYVYTFNLAFIAGQGGNFAVGDSMTMLFGYVATS